jgi:beta-lactam-binding protein with PASTA domain
MRVNRAATATFKMLCIVPKAKGKKLAAAKTAIKRSHCSVGKVTKVFSARAKAGRVVSQRLSPHKRLAPSSKVNLKVSRGKKPARR